CDDVDFRTGLKKPASQLRNGIGQAKKIRAAASNLFGITGGAGAMQWHVDPSTGRMIGNPSISPLVSRYMVGLAKRKGQAGESPMSARAITPVGADLTILLRSHRRQETMRSLYKLNRRNYKDLANESLLKRLLQACYTVAYLCLLRFEEVLRIQVQDIQWINDRRGRRLILNLPYRKTAHCAAKIQPFVLWPLGRDEAHLCPYRAITEWLHASDIKEGYLFPRLNLEGSIKLTKEAEHMTAESFLEHFRLNLLDIGLSRTTYGTHSFRRGGCQYLVVQRRWNLRRVCEWGGWSTDFNYLTIVRYIISFIDEPMSTRDDFFRPGQPVLKFCNACGRRCACNS
ncbi:hypothetical protein FB107DRAFT_222322, partial [Schizophyllum commune]